MKLSVVVPARNEASTIAATLQRLGERLAREHIDYELLVVDDGSADQTVERVEQRRHEDGHVRLVLNTGQHGFGRAVRCGIDHSSGDAVVIVMADGSDDPEDVVKYYYVLRDRAECAFGSRFIRGAYVERYPLPKLVLNRLANHLIRLLFRIDYNDITNAFKGYRKYVIDGVRPLISPHFNLTVEIPLKAIVRGYSYEVVPISWRERKAGRSMFHIQEMGSRYFFIILHVWLEWLLVKNDYYRTDQDSAARWLRVSPAQARPPEAGGAVSELRPLSSPTRTGLR
ncbi:MAG TPA: glycosyltransferase family 2 protein [Chloroflexota bacterium]|jgi:dolichol-phosphate mannosyltransferase|nr:glycosyltransferase family 2 protein [Chloroflexota bacterium]